MPLKNYFQDNVKPVNGKTGSNIAEDRSVFINVPSRINENHFMVELQKMQARNDHLKSLLVKQSIELTENAAINNKYISIIAHDLRSPLAVISGILNILKLGLSEYDIAEIEKYVNIASSSTKKTIELLESLLAWTFSQNKDFKFNPVKINLRRLLRDEFDNIKISAKQKQIKLNHAVPSNINVNADPNMVKTILRNLISNAIKYTNSGGEITISASDIKSNIEIAVRDNGIGISSEIQQNLFKFKGLQLIAGTHNEKGAGLGLLLCKEFIDKHNGNFQISSEPGKGSEFKFTLPKYVKKLPKSLATNPE
jgi:signal transduction histidine kinase